MPEGDTIFRTATLLRPGLVGQPITNARARRPGPAIEHVVGATVDSVEPRGKHLVIAFSNGLTLHTHMRMNGVWHVYRPGERWRRPEWQARVILETPVSTAVCFNAPVVELLRDAVAEAHRPLAGLGPDLMAADFDLDEALRRLRDPSRAAMEIGPALLDQRAMAGVGNVYKSEVLFLERLSPFAAVRNVPADVLRRLVERSRELLLANRATFRRTTTSGATLAAGSRLWVYGRNGRPCFRCRTRIEARLQGSDLPRRTFWCPACQRLPASGE